MNRPYNYIRGFLVGARHAVSLPIILIHGRSKQRPYTGLFAFFSGFFSALFFQRFFRFLFGFFLLIHAFGHGGFLVVGLKRLCRI